MGMNKNATINLRVNAEVKEQAGMILDAMGLSFSDAFNLMLHQVRIQRGLPFEVVAYSNAPNPGTAAFIERVESGEEELAGPFSSKEELWKSLGI
jgi:DNA-damage-inducible protein J